MPDDPTEFERADSHQALIYADEDQFLATALPYALAGLAAGGAVFVATGARNAALLRTHLGRQSRLVDFVDAREWYREPSRTLGAFHDKARAVPGRSYVVGEAVWSEQDRRQVREWTRFEALLNLALAATGARHLCPYDTRVVPRAIVRAARLTHPWLAAEARYRPNPAYVDPARFSASCDRAALPERPARARESAFTSLHQIGRIREFAAIQALGAGLSPERVDDLVVCVDEVATNAVRHGAGHGRCWIWATPDELLCEIADPRGTLNPALAGHLPPDVTRLDGRGLWIVRRLCDHVDIRVDRLGSRVRLHFDHPARPAAPRRHLRVVVPNPPLA